MHFTQSKVVLHIRIVHDFMEVPIHDIQGDISSDYLLTT